MKFWRILKRFSPITQIIANFLFHYRIKTFAIFKTEFYLESKNYKIEFWSLFSCHSNNDWIVVVFHSQKVVKGLIVEVMRCRTDWILIPLLFIYSIFCQIKKTSLVCTKQTLNAFLLIIVLCINSIAFWAFLKSRYISL